MLKYMSFNTYTSTFTENEDGSSTYTINMSDVTTKCMKIDSKDPKEWIDNAIDNKSRIVGERVYKLELDRHLENGTMPSNPTKGNLILAYEIPVVTETE
jgi:uncharacterized protein YdgA (DUF945 family)